MLVRLLGLAVLLFLAVIALAPAQRGIALMVFENGLRAFGAWADSVPKWFAPPAPVVEPARQSADPAGARPEVSSDTARLRGLVDREVVIDPERFTTWNESGRPSAVSREAAPPPPAAPPGPAPRRASEPVEDAMTALDEAFRILMRR
ncbi:MAG: hypothetical protein HY727_21610 [Candidatus Rokubacteria bacterium]|nr:hypothetical protein [Candidatus Rokubacteria bacterium]